jgi:hypothetical protein
MTTEQLHHEATSAIRRGDMPGAEALLRRIVALDPGNAAALSTLAGVLAEQGQNEPAVAVLHEALRHRPDDADALANVAALLYRLNREDEGIPFVRRSLALRPDDARAHMILAEALLWRGEFDQGWAQYEWRTRMPGYANRGRVGLPRPQWTGGDGGGDVAGKTVLVHGEQGLGDMIQMARYVPLLAARGARVMVECEASLRPLLSRLDGASVVLARSNDLPDFDLHCPVMSLPHAFGTTLATVPAGVPYLRPDAERMTQWSARLPSAPGMTIGLAWAGGPLATRRKCPAAVFSPLLSVPGVHFVSLQMPGPHVDPLAPPPGVTLTDLTAAIRDFDDTAALIERLDLVISVDTAVAHLAGAMGRPVWTLLPHAADWRWLKHRGDSPWYPTMRLFRQRSPGDWEGVIDDVMRALAGLR